MRVTHVITRLIVGGAQENTIATVLGLREITDVKVNLVSGPTSGPEGSLEKRVCAPGLLTILPSLVRPVRPISDFQALAHLRRIFRADRPDIVHTHSGKAGIVGRRAARLERVPVIIHTIHGPSFGPFQPLPANVVFKIAERMAARWTTHFISVAQAMTDQYLAAGIGRPEMYTRIFSGFNLQPFLEARNDSALRQRLGIQTQDLVVGKIARLFELKGHDDLFAISTALVKADNRIKFLLVGDGPWRERFSEKARALGLANHFIFTGLVLPEEVPKFVGIMDVLVHLSLREGLARALPQALAAGRPVVAYDCDGAREICLENETGFLVAPGDLIGLKQKLMTLLHSPELRHSFGIKGQEYVKARFSTERMVGGIYAVYRDLLGKAGELSSGKT